MKWGNVTVTQKTYVIDGKNFTDLQGFYDEVGQVLISDQPWGRNLDALNDILSWPSEGDGIYKMIWRNSVLSRQRLGHEALASTLETLLIACHPSYELELRQRLDWARRSEGPTLFDWLVEIIEQRNHCVRLDLE